MAIGAAMNGGAPDRAAHRGRRHGTGEELALAADVEEARFEAEPDREAHQD